MDGEADLLGRCQRSSGERQVLLGLGHWSWDEEKWIDLRKVRGQINKLVDGLLWG